MWCLSDFFEQTAKQLHCSSEQRQQVKQLLTQLIHFDQMIDKQVPSLKEEAHDAYTCLDFKFCVQGKRAKSRNNTTTTTKQKQTA